MYFENKNTERFIQKHEDGTISEFTLKSTMDMDIANLIYVKTTGAYAQLGIKPEFILLNKEAYDSLAVKCRGFVTEIMGYKIIYCPDQKEYVKVCFNAETQYFYGHKI